MTKNEDGKRAALYVRCSTGHQDTQLQRDDLTEFCRRRGWQVYKVFEDKGISGSTDSRPALDKMMVEARQRKFDVLAVWRFDRYGRSMAHLVNSLAEFESLGIDFASLQESVDTSTPAGRMLFGVISSMCEFERAIIRERVKAGVEQARARGVRWGRPRKGFDFKRAVEMRRNGSTRREIAKAMGVSHTTVLRAIRGT